MSNNRKQKPTYLNFDHKNYDWKSNVDYRKYPQKYKVGRGEQGVLICEPYKSEIVEHWQFKTPSLARKSTAKIYKLFKNYLEEDDFVGADMARKFLQMGFTRARRYANYKSGIKYDKDKNYQLKEKGTGDAQKAESAQIFFKAWKRAEANKEYALRKKLWKVTYG